MNDNDREIRIGEIRKISDRKFINLFEMRFSDRAGAEKTWVFASRQDPPKARTGNFDLPDAVVIAAFHTGYERLVVIRELRLPLAGYLYGFPAGLLDEGESVEDCARRELAEETGLTLTRVDRVSPPIYSSSGMTDESVAIAYVECTGKPSALNASNTEDIETVFVSREDAQRLCERSDVKFDVKTWLVLYGFAQSGRV